VRAEVRKSLNSLVTGQLFGAVLFLIGVALATWSYNNDQLMGQLFGGVLIFIGIVLAALAYNKRKRFVGTHEKRSPEPLRPA
jgi:drug/metabolite transporter (DMT)-like permease